jgi:hypothetical protein
MDTPVSETIDIPFCVADAFAASKTQNTLHEGGQNLHQHAGGWNGRIDR